MKEWTKEHPWMTFFIVLSILNIFGVLVTAPMLRAARRKELEEFAKYNNLQMPPKCEPGQAC